jgi:hypothetical protein
LSPIDASNLFNAAALRHDKNSNASYLSAVGEHPDSNERVTSHEDKIKAIKAVGLQVDSAKRDRKNRNLKNLFIAV